MKFCVIVDEEHNITDIFHAVKLCIHEKEENWKEVGNKDIEHNKPEKLEEVRELGKEVSSLVKMSDSNMLIGTNIVGIPYQILDKNKIYMCEADTLTQEVFSAIYEDFYSKKEEKEEEFQDVPDRPIMIAEDGFFYFDFDLSIKAHPELSSKKMLIPFLEKELYTCLTIQCSHIMPWLDYYVESHGLAMESQRKDGKYTVTITHGLCDKGGAL